MTSSPRCQFWPRVSGSKAGLGLPTRAQGEPQVLLHPGPYLKVLAPSTRAPL